MNDARQIARLRNRHCEARTLDLGPGPDPLTLLRTVADWDGLGCLLGAWVDGTPVLISHPVFVLATDADPGVALDHQPHVEGAGDLLGGGWFGSLAFDGASRMAFHDHVLRLVGGRWQFESLWCPERADVLDARRDAWQAAVAAPVPDPTPQWHTGSFDGPDFADHLAAVEQAVELIRAGELYQVNVCTRLHAGFDGSAAGMFADLGAALEPRYGALIGGPRPLVSLSPELFLRRRGRAVASEPIKGTRPRQPGDTDDGALRASTKDAAENVMIVDLVRNDLGRVSEIGTVRPDALLEVQPHPGVWHLVSRISGTLRADVGDAQLMAATFPPGSVTGAPKERALRAIEALESAPRRAYTGAIGFASPLWGAEFSVAIRTFEIEEGRIELGVGGGVTADSVPMLEWRECLHKATPLLEAARTRVVPALTTAEPTPDPALLVGGLLETVLGVDGRPVRLADHLARMDRSARELYGTGLPRDLAEGVTEAAKALPRGRAVLRIIVRPGPEIMVTAAPAAPRPDALDAITVVRPAGLWRHKWAERGWAAGLDQTVLVGADGAVLETARGNVFLIEPDGTLVTAPLRDDLLPGVTRRALLDHARDTGRRTVLRRFSVAELVTRPAFWTSSLSGAVPISRVDGVELPAADDLVAEFAEALIGGRSTVR